LLVVVFASELYGCEISFKLLLASFLVTFSVYSLNIVTDKKEDSLNKPEKAPQKTSYILTLSIIAMLVSLAIGITSGLFTLLILSAPLIVGLVYSVRFSHALPRLKEVVGVKSLAVAFSWAITGAFLPVTLQPITVSKEVLVILFSYIFAQMLVNTIIFDMLDMRGDLALGITTVPVALGNIRTKQVLLVINGLLFVWIVYCLHSGVFAKFMPVLVFGVIYQLGEILLFFGKKAKRLHAELIVDGKWVPLVMLIKATIAS
jgi:4-hydroxybenzoate polyprenyltransferase